MIYAISPRINVGQNARVNKQHEIEIRIGSIYAGAFLRQANAYQLTIFTAK